MTRQEDEKVELFRTVVCEQLQSELAKAQKDRQEILKELQEYASLLVVVRNMQIRVTVQLVPSVYDRVENCGNCTNCCFFLATCPLANNAGKINIRTSLGHQVFVNAELDRKDTVIVKLAGDLFAELKLERAEIFITQKLEILRKKAEICLELASKTKATMKFLMAAIGEYDKLAAKKK